MHFGMLIGTTVAICPEFLLNLTKNLRPGHWSTLVIQVLFFLFVCFLSLFLSLFLFLFFSRFIYLLCGQFCLYVCLHARRAPDLIVDGYKGPCGFLGIELRTSGRASEPSLQPIHSKHSWRWNKRTYSCFQASLVYSVRPPFPWNTKDWQDGSVGMYNTWWISLMTWVHPLNPQQIKDRTLSWAGCCSLVIPALREAEKCGSLRVLGQPGLLSKSRTAKATQRDPVSKKKKRNKCRFVLICIYEYKILEELIRDRYF